MIVFESFFILSTKLDLIVQNFYPKIDEVVYVTKLSFQPSHNVHSIQSKIDYPCILKRMWDELNLDCICIYKLRMGVLVSE